MTELLAFDWDKTHPTVTAATVSGSTVRVSRVIELEWPDSARPEDDPAVAGDWLKVELERHNIKATSAVLSIPREDAVVRLLELPNVPDHELAEIVRLQAATRSTVPLDQVKLDFLPLPLNDAVAGREVLMTTVTNRLVNECKKVLSKAGIELTNVGISSVAAADLVAKAARAHGLDADTLSLVVLYATDRLELTFLRSNRVLATHSSQCDGDNIDQIVAEINRVRFSVESSMQGNRLSRIWVVGKESKTEPLRNRLSEQLECDVRPFDVFTETNSKPTEVTLNEDRWALAAGSVGLLSATAAPLLENVDFLNPRQPAVKKDRRKVLYSLAAAAAVLIGVTGFVMFKMSIADYDQKIDAAKSESRDIKQIVKNGEDTVKSADIVQIWQRRNTNWLNQFAELTKTLPSSEFMLVEEIVFSSTPNAAAFQGHIKATGRAKTVKDLQDLNTRLRKKGLAVTPQGTSEATGGTYPHEMKLDVDIPIQSTSTNG
jgi:Tfp pilus assembly PilM family ATPase